MAEDWLGDAAEDEHQLLVVMSTESKEPRLDLASDEDGEADEAEDLDEAEEAPEGEEPEEAEAQMGSSRILARVAEGGLAALAALALKATWEASRWTSVP